MSKNKKKQTKTRVYFEAIVVEAGQLDYNRHTWYTRNHKQHHRSVGKDITNLIRFVFSKVL